MNLPKYDLTANRSLTAFKFTSKGPQGLILKAVIFAPIGDGLYNLVLVDVSSDTGYLDDIARSDNQDMEKILATVAACIYAFTEMYPDKEVFIQGSTGSRTRLYRLAINKFLSEIKGDFQVSGVKKDKLTKRNKLTKFEKDTVINYDAFQIKRKKK
jgi:hypothetical protein